jgi:hypothetical protein
MHEIDPFAAERNEALLAYEHARMAGDQEAERAALRRLAELGECQRALVRYWIRKGKKPAF